MQHYNGRQNSFTHEIGGRVLCLGLGKAVSVAFGRQGGWVEVQDMSLGSS